MEAAPNLVTAMAKNCRELIQPAASVATDLPAAVQPARLLWMCDRIEEHASDWPDAKLHRWLGFIQAALLANRILDLNAAKAMFDVAKAEHGETAVDQDLVDHLDPRSSFQMDLGGQG